MNRQIKGLQISKTAQIKKEGNGWIVPSQSYSNKSYFVNEDFICDCPDSIGHKITCKHAYAVRYSLKTEIDTPKGTIIKEKRITYPQAWAIYDKCQQEEKIRFMELLNDLLKEIPETTQNKKGRHTISGRVMIFSSALKVYSQFSLRRFISDLNIAKNGGYVDYTPCFASIGHYMQKESITPILSKLVQLSSLALRSVEKDFAVDSSGFRTTQFNEYCRIKHRTGQKHRFIKCHVMTGVKTNIITAVELNVNQDQHDTTQFIPLVKMTHDNGFQIEEVSADKAYCSKPNMEFTDKIGAKPFIPFLVNTSYKSDNMQESKIWRKMYWYFKLYNNDFMSHYHKRSNVETTFFMLKAKFGDALKSKTKTAQINELLLKVLCHNIVVVNNEFQDFKVTE